ncbi:hypothetical protein ACX80O_02315 [Arthrobacter sp. Hz1]
MPDIAEMPYRHGKAGASATGYRKGCRCAGCRRIHSDKMKAYRATKKLQEAGDAHPEYDLPPEVTPSSAAISWSAEPGQIERALCGELDALIGEPPFKRTLIVLAKYNARVLDQLPQMERLDLVSGMQTRLFNVFDRLRRVELAPGAAGSWDMSALTTADE